MVTFQQSGKFFTRHSGGKHQLDVLELRDAFLNSRSASERAEEFRTARLGRLIGGGAPVPLSSDKVLCVHAVPHGSLFGALAVDLQKATVHNVELRPMEASGWGPRFNIDGVISVASSLRGTNSTGYVQLFRNGIVEVAFSDVFFDPPADMKLALAGVGAGRVSKELVGAVERLQRLFPILEVPPAVSFFISLHGMKEVAFHVSQRLSSYGRYAFDRETILLPEVVARRQLLLPRQIQLSPRSRHAGLRNIGAGCSQTGVGRALAGCRSRTLFRLFERWPVGAPRVSRSERV